MGFRCFYRNPPLKPSWIHLRGVAFWMSPLELRRAEAHMIGGIKLWRHSPVCRQPTPLYSRDSLSFHFVRPASESTHKLVTRDKPNLSLGHIGAIHPKPNWLKSFMFTCPSLAWHSSDASKTPWATQLQDKCMLLALSLSDFLIGAHSRSDCIKNVSRNFFCFSFITCRRRCTRDSEQVPSLTSSFQYALLENLFYCFQVFWCNQAEAPATMIRTQVAWLAAPHLHLVMPDNCPILSRARRHNYAGALREEDLCGNHFYSFSPCRGQHNM